MAAAFATVDAGSPSGDDQDNGVASPSAKSKDNERCTVLKRSMSHALSEALEARPADDVPDEVRRRKDDRAY